MKSISHSATEKFENCPKSYFFHYVRKIRAQAKGSALFFGSAMDEGLNQILLGQNDYKEKFLETWEKARNEKLNYSNGDLEGGLLDPFPWSEDEIKAMKRENPHDPKVQEVIWSCLNKKGIILLEEYKEQVMPQIKEVLAVQKFVNLPNGEGQSLAGVIDFIAVLKDGTRAVMDNKTSSIKYAADSVQLSPQLATYYSIERDNYNLTHAGFVVIQKSLRKLKKPRVQIDIIVDRIPDALVHSTFERYDKVLGEIRDGNFPRRLEGCKTKFGPCDYYQYCHHGIKDGLIEEE